MAATTSAVRPLSPLSRRPCDRLTKRDAVWKQNGTLANTGAWFLAVSKEYNLRHHHMIVPDGYNLGRNLLVEAAEKGGKWKQWHWKARTEFVEGLLEPGKEPRESLLAAHRHGTR